MLRVEIRYILSAYGVVCLLFSTGKSQENVCTSELDGQVCWPNTTISSCSRSQPFCLSGNMEILSRCCDTGGNWADAPSCSYYQDTITNPCPDHFDWKSNICVFVIEDTVYPPPCPYEENLPFSKYISVVSISTELFPIWMPVQRIIGEYGVDLFRWMEPTPNYKSPYTSCSNDVCDDSYHYDGSISDKNCFVYHNSSFIEAVSCTEKHTAVCAYQSLPERLRSFCSQSFSAPCVQSSYSSSSKCFCQGLTNQSSTVSRAEFLEPYQNLLFSSLNGTCLIGLENANGSYIWRHSKENIKYTNWAETAVFKDSHKYGAITSSGWVMSDAQNESDCILYEMDVPTSNSEIILSYAEDDKFVLKLTNPSNWLFEENGTLPMVFCFTDSSSNALITKVNISDSNMLVDEAQFYFQKHEDGPGTYWCEGFLYPDVIPKSSNKYLLRYNDSHTEEYVVILKRSYPKDTNPITESNIYEYQKDLSDQVLSLPDISHFQVRIYKIEEVDETNNRLSINFHLVNPNPSKALAYYSTLRDYMEINLTGFTFVKILDVDSCVGVQTSQSVTWPVVPVNTVAKPREGYCIGSDGYIVNRHCFGNYIDGASWMDLDEHCTIQQSTNTTVNLTNIINLNNAEEYMEQVVEISRNNLELLPRDITLISYFFDQVAYSENINLISVSTIINQIMSVPKKVLKQSQTLFNATDRILHQFDNIVHQSNFVGEIEGENIFITSSYLKDCNLSIIVVGEHNIDKVCNISNLTDTLQMNNMKAMLYLGDSLVNSLLDEDSLKSKIVVTVYKNSNLFNEVGQRAKNTNIIFGVSFPYVQDIKGQIFTIHNVSNSETDIICSFWDYALHTKRGSWVEGEGSRSNNSVTCTYNSPMHFTLVRNEEVNITQELESLLQSDDLLSERLQETFLLLKDYYEKFQAIDLQLISELLHLAADGNEDNLELVTDIINVIVDIPKEVLHKSQDAYNATGKILFYFDQILQKSGVSQIIEKSNVYAVVQFLKEDFFHGFTMDHCDSECNLNLLTEEITFEDLSAIEKLDTALIISSEMLNQLLLYNKEDYVPKIVTTVFFKDSLFIEDYSDPKIKTKVVGVSFPNFNENQEGNIALMYNIDVRVSLNYTCSVYQSDTDDATIVRGFWNTESPAELRNGLQLCQFWKSTYFALIYNLGNLTFNLESMLDSTEDVEIILNKTRSITRNYYEYLQPVDLFIIMQLLSKAKEITGTILEVCVSIMNDIMKVSSATLRTSEEEYNTTNMLLDTFNDIAEKYNATKEIYRENIVLIISLLEDTDMYGVSLENCSQQCDLSILNNKSSILEKTSLNNFDLKLIISSNLIKNVLNAKSENYTARLVLIVFYSDILFAEKNPRSTRQIFGIYFPGYNETLSSDVELSLQLSTSSISESYTCMSWTFWDQSQSDIEGFWTYESQPRDHKILTCKFYRQNYFTISEGTIIFDNITKVVENIVNLDISFIEKLYKGQDISYHYQQFEPYDIYQFSQILLQCNAPSDDALDMVNIIVNNILCTPEEILKSSEIKHNALREILHGINHISYFQDSRQYSLLYDQFGVVICQLNSESANGVILTKYDIKCTYKVDSSTFDHAENVVATLILSKEIVSQAAEEGDNPKIIVSVFTNDIFFHIEDNQSPDLILGLSLPTIQDKLKGDIEVLFNYSSYSGSEYDCGYWENLDDWKFKPGEDMDDFMKCNYSDVTYFTLWDSTSSNNTINITEALNEIINANFTIFDKLSRTLKLISSYPEKFKARHVYLISKILSHVESFDLECLKCIADIVDKVMNLPQKVLLDSQVQYSATDWILYHIDRITEYIEEPLQIKTDSFSILSSENILGILVEVCNNDYNVKILLDANFTNMDGYGNISTAMIFDDVLRKEIQKSPSSQVVVTFYFNNALFNEEYDVSYKTVGPIIGIVIPSQNDKLNGSLQFFYPSKNGSTELCAFWNYTIEEGEVTKGHWQMNKPLHQHSQVTLCESKYTTHFALLQTKVNVTSDLENILNSNSTVKEKLEEVVTIITDAVNLRPVDIYLISMILEIALEDMNIIKMNLTSLIVSSLFQVPRNVLRESQLTYFATDKILYIVEEMAKALSDIEVDPIVQDNFTVAIYDVKKTNMSGILLENCSNAQCDISVLNGATNLTELVNNQNLQTAIALSDELLDQVRQHEGFSKLVVTIYFSDVLFNEQIVREGKVSMVCGVLLPGFNDTFLGNLKVIFNRADEINYSSSCAFWNFQMEDGEETVTGSWKSEFDPRSKEHLSICEYDHVTHFALLLARDDSHFLEANKYKILDIITLVNSVLSIIGIFGILLTAAMFERWRKNTGNQILIHFSIAMSIKMIMLYVSAGVYNNEQRKLICAVTGAILHFSILSEFCWMLIIAILQFKRFVEVLGGPPKFVLLKACICGWVFPLLPVLLIFLIDRDNYTEGKAGLCYPSGLGLYLGIWLPIIIIVSINFVIFIFIIYNVFHKKTETRDIVNHEILFQWRLALLLFSMLGLTWLFGFLSQVPGLEIIFVYLFCISATLQGFIMFLFFIVFNKSTRFLYSQSIKMWLYAKGYKMH